MADNYLHQSTDEIEYFSVKMFKPNMDSIPYYPLPSGYSLQLYKNDSNDDQKWVDIAKAAGEFKSIEQGFVMFEKYYQNYKENDLLSTRVYFLVSPDGKYIGTASAGIDQIDGKEQGSLWWVSIIPEYQGKKLAKPIISYVLLKIAEYSNTCYLDSQTTSWKAINMYADFGFVPSMLKPDNYEKAWRLLSKLCKRKFIDDID
ncbi:unnamed protein product [Didymodactylos carnosus]|uniref:N-acetyltransferase domain-containing protein n=1 Tax=Didymodactylos carnosus TaxID=1234261 RepID=A0A814ZGF1_9BILA|nr:unnamed protein product [Didymodactylos carnosus]CAF1241990.1 unnamed protein product [Didymodactylos carnosus]CAF3722789.1 unnamed protein product [Didymodactylos carnosus]CAF4005485.1 unnamed protein product [Didymodactylos carnosus]